MPVPGERARSVVALPALRPGVLPAAAGVAAFGLFAWTLLNRANSLQLPAYDTAFFEQVVWNLGHGRGFTSGFFAASFLGLHFEPLLAVPALLERAWSDARLLDVVHALALAASAPSAYLMLSALLTGRPHGTWLAAALAAPVPLWAEVQQAVVAGFHPEALALPLELLAAWAGLRGRSLLCWTLALLALTAKEDQAYAVAVIGVLLAFRGPSRIQGAALAAVAVLYGAAVELLVMPAFRGGVVSQVDSYYHWLHTATPRQVAAMLANPAGWLAFGGLVAGVAGLPLLRPAWLALAAPPLLADLLSAHYPQPELHFQYGLPLVVPLLVAAGAAARATPAWPPAAVAAVLALPPLVVGALWGPVLSPHEPAASPRAASQLARCTSALPATAAVATDDSAATPLASRPVLRLLGQAKAGDFVVVDRAGRVPSYIVTAERDRVLAGLDSQRRLLCDDGRFQLWSPGGANVHD